MDDWERAAAGPPGRVEIRCIGCGYGAVVARLPDRCPMCGACRWQRIRSTPLHIDGLALPGAELDHPSRGVGHL
jgi:hypothetical protein